MIGQSFCINPIVPCTCTGIDFDGGRQQVNDLPIPPAHLPTRIPERTHDGAEVAPCSISQMANEGRTLQFRRGRIRELELGFQPAVDDPVILDWVTEVKDNGLRMMERANERHGGGGDSAGSV